MDSEGSPNPHTARLGSLLAGAVPSPSQAFFSVMGHPPPRLFLPFSNYPHSCHIPPSPETPWQEGQVAGKWEIQDHQMYWCLSAFSGAHFSR